MQLVLPSLSTKQGHSQRITTEMVSTGHKRKPSSWEDRGSLLLLANVGHNRTSEKGVSEHDHEPAEMIREGFLVEDSLGLTMWEIAAGQKAG